MKRDRILFLICLRDAKRRERKVTGPINMSMSGVYITYSLQYLNTPDCRLFGPSGGGAWTRKLRRESSRHVATQMRKCQAKCQCIWPGSTRYARDPRDSATHSAEIPSPQPTQDRSLMARASTPPDRHRYNVDSTSFIPPRRSVPIYGDEAPHSQCRRMRPNKRMFDQTQINILSWWSLAGKGRPHFDDTLTEFGPRRRCCRGSICFTYLSPARGCIIQEFAGTLHRFARNNSARRTFEASIQFNQNPCQCTVTQSVPNSPPHVSEFHISDSCVSKDI